MSTKLNYSSGVVSSTTTHANIYLFYSSLLLSGGFVLNRAYWLIRLVCLVDVRISLTCKGVKNFQKGNQFHCLLSTTHRSRLETSPANVRSGVPKIENWTI